MRLSIAIVNWNTSKLLDKCVEAIYRHAPDFEFEILVVDNASADFDAADFHTKFPAVRLFANDRNLCYAEGNNQAISESIGEYVLLLNPDTEVKAGTIETLVGFMDSHSDAAAAGCRLVRPDGTVERSVRSFPSPGPVAWEFLGISKLFPKSRTFGAYRMTWFGYDEEALVDQPMGSCLIMSRKAIAQLGNFDQDFPIFFNEVDWCYRAKQAGWKIYFTPDPEVLHHGGAGTKQVRGGMRRESHRSLARFYNKHYRGRISPLVYWPIIAATRVSELL